MVEEIYNATYIYLKTELVRNQRFRANFLRPKCTQNAPRNVREMGKWNRPQIPNPPEMGKRNRPQIPKSYGNKEKTNLNLIYFNYVTLKIQPQQNVIQI